MGGINKLNIIPTFCCNQACKICRQDIQRSWLVKRYVANNQILLDLCNEIPQGIEVHLTGGEVTLSPQFTCIVKKLSKRSIHFGLVTNGVLLDNFIDLLVIYPPNYIVVSIDTLEPEMYAYIRGGKPEQLSRALQAVLNLRKNRRGEHPHLRANFTVQPDNIKCLLRVAQKYRKLGFDSLSVSHLQWCAITSDNNILDISSNGSQYALLNSSNIKFDSLHKVLSRLSREIVQHPYMEPQKLRHFYSSLAPLLHPVCRWPWEGRYVLPNGEVLICSDLSVGDLGHDSIVEILKPNSKSINNMLSREQSPSRCHTCCHRMLEFDHGGNQ
jgi:MoaA/NifB/PqqE/SkfB family radical SAM enzyme